MKIKNRYNSEKFIFSPSISLSLPYKKNNNAKINKNNYQDKE